MQNETARRRMEYFRNKGAGAKETDERRGWDLYTNRNYRSEERRGTDAWRSYRRSRNIGDHLIEAEKVRLDGIRKSEESDGGARKRREQDKYAPPRTNYWEEDKRK